jgi:SAM-dependent methyltransferase
MVFRESLKEHLPAAGIRAFRGLFEAFYIAAEPLDFAARVLNNRADYPPIRLRSRIGDLRQMEMVSAEFMAYLKLLAHLQRSDRVLDIGCGCGLMALQLANYLDASGRYVGIDPARASINWCRRHISPKYPAFSFEHMNIVTPYSRSGRVAAEEYRFPFSADSFDFVLLKSVFTHMRPQQVNCYLEEIRRVLAPRGSALITLFLMNDEQRRLAAAGLNEFAFKYGDPPWYYGVPGEPENRCAFDEGYMLDLLAQKGLALEGPIVYGTWSGRADGISCQDMVLIKRSDAYASSLTPLAGIAAPASGSGVLGA